MYIINEYNILEINSFLFLFYFCDVLIYKYIDVLIIRIEFYIFLFIVNIFFRVGNFIFFNVFFLGFFLFVKLEYFIY